MSTVVDLESLGSSGFAARGAAPGDGAGGSVAVIGDFNGDGFDDFVIGAPGNDSGGSNSGAAYLIYGKPGGFGTLDLANLQPGDGFQIQGHMGGSNAGLSVASAGDVNGDGFDDFLVGSAAHGLFGYGWNLGAAVIFGRAEKPTGIDLTGYSPQIFSGIGTGYYGVVASAGDINGDGFDDIILGSQFDSGGAGAAYVIFGKESAWTSMDGTDLGSNGFVIDGTDLVSVGESVSSAGDINGDGFDEIIVTAREEGVYPYGSTPAAYVIFGKETGFADVDLSSLAPTDGFLIQSQYEFYSNRVWVASAGDVNGDDFADILIRVPASNGYAGSAYVIFGKEDGFGQIYLATLGSSSGFAIQGMSHSGAGASVSAAGDFNGDGFDDLLIGAPNAGSSYSGDAVVIFGRETGFGTIDLSTLAPSDGFIMQTGSAFDHAGFSVSGGGDINDDGLADIIVGAFVDFSGLDSGAAYVLFGERNGATAGGAGNDFLFGGFGNQTLTGLAGNDYLEGGGLPIFWMAAPTMTASYTIPWTVPRRSRAVPERTLWSSSIWPRRQATIWRPAASKRRR